MSNIFFQLEGRWRRWGLRLSSVGVWEVCRGCAAGLSKIAQPGSCRSDLHGPVA
eukprot:COSAG01_NODE_6344_length_3723_cov_68.518212_9_plen_54_part_00